MNTIVSNPFKTLTDEDLKKCLYHVTLNTDCDIFTEVHDKYVSDYKSVNGVPPNSGTFLFTLSILCFEAIAERWVEMIDYPTQ